VTTEAPSKPRQNSVLLDVGVVHSNFARSPLSWGLVEEK
jgi:hypothetical protein